MTFREWKAQAGPYLDMIANKHAGDLDERDHYVWDKAQEDMRERAAQLFNSVEGQLIRNLTVE